MRRIVAILLLVAQAAGAASAMAGSDPSACAALCGKWTLDIAASDRAEVSLDAVLATYKEPKPRRNRRAPAGDTVGGVVAEMERSIGPILDRPRGADLRAELLPQVTPPPALSLAADGNDLLVSTGGFSRRFTIGRSHARVDAVGTAKIQVSWKAGSLIISENYGRGRSSTETYALRRADGALLVTREIRRPGLKALRPRAVYHRERTPG